SVHARAVAAPKIDHAGTARVDVDAQVSTGRRDVLQDEAVLARPADAVAALDEIERQAFFGSPRARQRRAREALHLAHLRLDGRRRWRATGGSSRRPATGGSSGGFARGHRRARVGDARRLRRLSALTSTIAGARRLRLLP